MIEPGVMLVRTVHLSNALCLVDETIEMTTHLDCSVQDCFCKIKAMSKRLPKYRLLLLPLVAP